jgi:hypothetical protein
VNWIYPGSTIIIISLNSGRLIFQGIHVANANKKPLDWSKIHLVTEYTKIRRIDWRAQILRVRIIIQRNSARTYFWRFFCACSFPPWALGTTANIIVCWRLDVLTDPQPRDQPPLPESPDRCDNILPCRRLHRPLAVLCTADTCLLLQFKRTKFDRDTNRCTLRPLRTLEFGMFSAQIP